MPTDLQRVLAKITEQGTAGKVRALHDSARLSSPVTNPRVSNAHDFARVIGAFVNRQIEKTGGSRYNDFEARAVAKEMLIQHGRRANVNKTYNNFVRDAIDGRNNGLRGILDILTDQIREQQAGRYISDAIDQVIDPLDYDRKKSVTREMIAHFQMLMPGTVEDPRSEVYVHDYDTLLREVGRQLDQTSDNLRRY